MRTGKNYGSETHLNRCDNFETQKEAFDLLFKCIHIDRDKKIRAPFWCNGLINSYIFPFHMIHTNTDFFETNI